eukprot:5229979-Amphidinium_carterae.1
MYAAAARHCMTDEQVLDGEPGEGVHTYGNDREMEEELDIVTGGSTLMLTQAHRQSLLHFPTHRLALHVHVPASLGIGHTDAPHKAAALAHQVRVETAS